jgi:hypothetical protein
VLMTHSIFHFEFFFSFLPFLAYLINYILLIHLGGGAQSCSPCAENDGQPSRVQSANEESRMQRRQL